MDCVAFSLSVANDLSTNSLLSFWVNPFCYLSWLAFFHLLSPLSTVTHLLLFTTTIMPYSHYSSGFGLNHLEHLCRSPEVGLHYEAYPHCSHYRLPSPLHWLKTSSCSIPWLKSLAYFQFTSWFQTRK